MVVLQIHKLISVESHIDGELHVTHLKFLAIDSELDNVWEGPTNVALLEAEGGQELQCELLVCKLPNLKECIPSTKENEMSDLHS